jgi:hypothetical protein
MKLTRSLVSVALAFVIGVMALPQTAAHAEPTPGASDHAATSAQPLACYEGRIPDSSYYNGTVSAHVYGSACKTRWAVLVYDNDNNCCVPVWVKIDRQVNGSYGWLTTHTQTKKVLSGAFGTHKTATVPWVQYSNQRFRACLNWGVSQPSTWNCGDWVN